MELCFEPMLPAEVPSFLERLTVGFAEDSKIAGLVAADGALASARAQISQALPQGAATPNHFFLRIRENRDGPIVGSLWYAFRVDRGPKIAFVYFIEVDPAYRRRGIAERTLHCLERVAADEGCRSIGLNVFGQNQGAISLYRKLGFADQAILMRKEITPSGSASPRTGPH